MNVTLSDIRSHLQRTIGSVSDEQLKTLILDSVMEAMPEVLAKTREAERLAIASDLDRLSIGRMDYVGKEPEHAGDIEALPGMLKVVYGEAVGARNLARIIRGEVDDKGWLPSWRWQR